MSHSKCSYRKCANAVGLFLVILYAICLARYYVLPVESELHMSLLKLSFLGFTGMNLTSIVLGAVQVYLWGYIGVGLWTLVGCCTKPGEGAGMCCQNK